LPTEAGIAFYERALRAITEANEAEAATQGAGTGLEGRLRICAPVTFARLYVVPKLGAFLEPHPKLRGALVMDDRPIDLVASISMLRSGWARCPMPRWWRAS